MLPLVLVIIKVRNQKIWGKWRFCFETRRIATNDEMGTNWSV